MTKNRKKEYLSKLQTKPKKEKENRDVNLYFLTVIFLFTTSLL